MKEEKSYTENWSLLDDKPHLHWLSPELFESVNKLFKGDKTVTDDMKSYLESMKKNPPDPDSKMTHLFVLLVLAKECINPYAESIETHYTTGSIVSTVKFCDGKTYTIEIKEKN